MGHKVHPLGFRLGFIKDWQSKWYTDTHYVEFLLEDVKLRDTIHSRYREAAISLVEIDRQAKDVTLTLHTARPGIVIGRGGQRVDEMRAFLEKLVGKRVRVNIQEVRQPELDAYLVARAIAEQIERRVAYRRAMKQAMFRTIQAGAKGIKVSCAGRLGNAEIARRQTFREGQVPLHTLRADIDYGFTEAHTTLGRIGVKVWIYKGQILPELKVTEAAAPAAEPATEEARVAPPAAETVQEEAAPVTTEGAGTPPVETAEKGRSRRKTAPEAAAEAPAEAVTEAAAPTETTPPPAEAPKRRSTRPAARTRAKTADSAESAETPAETEPSTSPEKEEDAAA